MQTTTYVPITVETRIVSDGFEKHEPPVVVQGRPTTFYKTNTLPKGGTFKSGVYKVTAGQHISASIHPGEPGSMSVKYKTGKYTRFVTLRGPLCPTLTVQEILVDCDEAKYERLRDLALTRAFAKLGKPSIELGAELGELGETLQMLRNPLKGLRNFLSKDREYWSRALAHVIKNRKYPTRQLKLTGKTVSETWLEIRYGIMPFIRSIQELVELSLDKKAVDINKISTVGAVEKDIIIGSLSKPKVMFHSAPIIEPKITGKRVTSVEVKARVYFRRKHALSFSRQLGLDIVNVPEIMWQLATCSFILDWFANVGDFVASWRYTPEIQVLGSTVSYRFSVQGAIAYDWDNSLSSGVTWIEKPRRASATGRSEYYFRSVGGTSPPGLPRFLVTSKLSIPKAIDLALIATQRIKPLLHRKQ